VKASRQRLRVEGRGDILMFEMREESRSDGSSGVADELLMEV
jgi:hypothetical protein